MRILVTGASGLIGSAVVPALESAGQEVVKLQRSAKSGPGPARWDPANGQIQLRDAEPLHAVVHLAGENVGSRWSAARKARIRQSRVEGTLLLCSALAALRELPRVLVCASAAGFYGHRGDEWLDEHSAPGTGFLAEVCRDWEAAADAAAQKGIRVVQLRFGIVLSARGGALARMLPIFKPGLGGRIGDGKQYWSWIALEDAVAVLRRALEDELMRGPFNAVAPNPARNREFTRALGKALARPTLFPLPAFAARLLLGEMADETLLASARVKPARLLAAGFKFQFPELEPALRQALTARSDDR